MAVVGCGGSGGLWWQWWAVVAVVGCGGSGGLWWQWWAAQLFLIMGQSRAHFLFIFCLYASHNSNIN